MHTWHWRTWENLPYLTCSLLDFLPHGFFTAQFSPRLPSELAVVLHPNATVYRVKQVHGNVVLTPNEVKAVAPSDGETPDTPRSLSPACGLSPAFQKAAQNSPDFQKSGENLRGECRTVQNAGEFSALPPADGLITLEPQQAVWVASADCTPVLIADVQTGQVAAIHAGWRGTAMKIVPTAIARFQTSKIQDLRIAMGPAIAGVVYQVSVQVATQVLASILSFDPQTNENELLDKFYQIPNSPVLPDPTPGRVRLDVRRVNALQLEQLGICAEQVAIAPNCTYAEPEHFFSYRRSKEKKVQWSGIVSIEPNKQFN